MQRLMLLRSKPKSKKELPFLVRFHGAESPQLWPTSPLRWKANEVTWNYQNGHFVFFYVWLLRLLSSPALRLYTMENLPKKCSKHSCKNILPPQVPGQQPYQNVLIVVPKTSYPLPDCTKKSNSVMEMTQVLQGSKPQLSLRTWTKIESLRGPVQPYPKQSKVCYVLKDRT